MFSTLVRWKRSSFHKVLWWLFQVWWIGSFLSYSKKCLGGDFEPQCIHSIRLLILCAWQCLSCVIVHRLMVPWNQLIDVFLYIHITSLHAAMAWHPSVSSPRRQLPLLIPITRVMWLLSLAANFRGLEVNLEEVEPFSLTCPYSPVVKALGRHLQ